MYGPAPDWMTLPENAPPVSGMCEDTLIAETVLYSSRPSAISCRKTLFTFAAAQFSAMLMPLHDTFASGDVEYEPKLIRFGLSMCYGVRMEGVLTLLLAGLI